MPHERLKRRGFGIAAVAAFAAPSACLVPSGLGATAPLTRVVVLAAPGRLDALAAQLRGGGAAIVDRYETIGGLVADAPDGAVTAALSSGVATAAAADRAVTLSSTDRRPRPLAYDPSTDPGSLANIARQIGATAYWSAGFTGHGVDVALIDTGVDNNAVGLKHLAVAGFDASGSNKALTDGFGHGTHMAGIIAANSTPTAGTSTGLVGIAPGSRLVSVKVADDDGATSTAKVIAGIDWVAAHHADPGMNIRVANLSFGAPPMGTYATDPLAAAVERLTATGVVVVAAAGNAGPDNGLASPAYDPRVLTVGALDHRGTLGTGDDTVADYSSSAATGRTVDVVAPGRSVQSAVGGKLAKRFPGAVVDKRYLRGTGTSQAAAVVSGAVALVLQQHPTASPAAIQQLVERTARPTPDPVQRQGGGQISLADALNAPIFDPGQTVDPAAAAGLPADDSTWSGSRWAGSRWAGSRWAELAWMASWP